MNYEQFSYAIHPPQTFVECFDRNCFIVVCDKRYELKPHKINVIISQWSLPEQYVLKVQPHCNENENWKLMGTYFPPDATSRRITFPVLVQRPYVLQEGECLCHVKPILVSDVFTQLRGKILFTKCFIKFNDKHLTFTDAENDLIFVSDSE